MGQTEEIILESALREFSRMGFADAKIETIAANCGVNKVTVFRHFESKEKLFQAVIDTYIRHLSLPEPPSLVGLPLEKGLYELCMSQFIFVFEHIHALRIEIQAEGLLEQEQSCFRRALERSILSYLNTYGPFTFSSAVIAAEMLACYVIWVPLGYNKNQGIWEINDHIRSSFETSLKKNISFITSALKRV